MTTERRRLRSRRQRTSTLVMAFLTWVVGFGILSAVALQDRVPPEDLLMDRTSATGQPWYLGFVTALGVLAWTVASCSCVFTAWIAHWTGRPRARGAFGSGFLLFTFLLMDDLFRLHSDLLPRLLGLSKHTIMAAYLGGAILWTWRSWTELRRTRWELLAAAIAGLGGSLMFDIVVSGADVGRRVLVEDGLKFLGLLALAVWAAASAADISRAAIQRSS